MQGVFFCLPVQEQGEQSKLEVSERIWHSRVEAEVEVERSEVKYSRARFEVLFRFVCCSCCSSCARLVCLR